MTLSDSEHYAESFASVDDWTTSDTSISTDDDVATITENGAGSTGRAYASFSSTDFFEFYYEFRIVSMTATTANLEFWDGDSYETLKTFTAAGTYKGIISDADAATMQRIGFLVGSEGGNVLPDYLRISRSNETGFSHDGSTTEGLTDDGGAGKTFAYSSDGDILTLNVTHSASPTGSTYVYLSTDTTTTVSQIERDYYPFMSLRYKISSSSTMTPALLWCSDGYYSIFTTVVDGAWHTVYLNHKAATDVRAGSYFYIYCAAYPSKTFEVELDYVKAGSIANWTYSGSSVTTDDYLYVDSGVLYSNVDSGYIEADHDPALSVTDTYSVWNLTTGSTAPQFSQYVSSWSSYSSETRGSLTSGTLTDIKLNFTADGDISAITFIEDATAPVVVRSFATPDPADDDETVTLSAVVEDSVLVYEVNFNAITYPVGFSDVDYSATESTDNLWTYSFSTLTAGYYCFKILGSDGANLNALTEYGYISLSVREAAININPITFFGVGEDFTQMQISFEINKDCTFTIYEASDSVAETDTHTGSVSEGWDNIAWDKLTTTDTAVNFSISFVSGSLSTWINGSYAVAQVTFDVVLSDKTTTFDYVYLEGESTKAAAYAVYDINNLLRGSGTIPEGSFALSFEIWNKKSLTETFYGVKFTNGSSTDWINGTYYADDPEEYKGGGVVTVPPWWQDPMTWVIIGGFAALMFIATSGQKVGSLPNAPKGLK